MKNFDMHQLRLIWSAYVFRVLSVNVVEEVESRS